MATITATHLTSDGGSSSSSFNTASISPSADHLVIVSVTSGGSGSRNTPSVSGAGLTFVEIDNTTTTNTKTSVFRALSSSPSSGALTIDFSGQSQDRCVWSVNEFDNVNKDGDNGESAVVQSAVNSSNSSSGLTATLGSFSNTDNATFGATGAQSNSGGTTITPGSGFTELSDDTVQPGSFFTSHQSQWRNDNDTTVDSSKSGSAEYTIIGLEISNESEEAITFKPRVMFIN